jgi:matrixin
MLRKSAASAVVSIALIATTLPSALAVTTIEPVGYGAHRWLRNPIIVSLSTSIGSPPANIKKGTDVRAAAERALQSWSAAAGIQFLETTTSNEKISPATDGDGVSLITVSVVNASEFAESDAPARTRVFFDSGGTITEADIALNPAALFSDDGTFGTFDLESTLAHEVGHLLGLTHSAVIGATMQPRQAKNGVYGLTAFTQRTLSAVDVTAVRALYSEQATYASISGRLSTNISGRSRSILGAQLFAEDVATGGVTASSISSAAGAYRVDGLSAGVYRVFAQPLDGAVAADEISNGPQSLMETTPLFRSFVASNKSLSQSLNVSANSDLKLSFFIFSHTPALKPQLIGMNGELSTAPLPLRPGEAVTIYVAGEGVDDVALDGISISSPLISIVPGSLREAKFDTPFPVMSFDIAIAHTIQSGEYTIRLQTTKGELAFLPGAITIDGR